MFSSSRISQDRRSIRLSTGLIGKRYDATEVMQGVTEVPAYGAAVLVEPLQK